MKESILSPEGVKQEFESSNLAIANTQKSMTYVVDGDRCANSVPQGQYFQLINSSVVGRSDGIYTASKAIPANTAIDNTYFKESAPITGGAINALNGNLGNISSALMTATSVSDFNAALTTGLYKGAPGTTNQPLNDYNVLYVFAYNTSGNDVGQLAISINNCKFFYRTRKDGTTWVEWKELALKSDFTIKSSDSIGSGIRAYKTGRVVYLSFEAAALSKNYSANETVVTLPSDYRPIYPFSFVDSLRSIRFAIGLDGTIAPTVSATSGNIRGFCSYISSV